MRLPNWKRLALRFLMPVCIVIYIFSAAVQAQCIPDETTLCLQSGRFRVTLEWTDFTGNEYSLYGIDQSGSAHFTSLNDDTALFWFFSEGNVEGMIRILDGRQVNGHFWLFATFLTNMNPHLVVKDLDTNSTRTYYSPQGFAPPILDTLAFPDPDKSSWSPVTPEQEKYLLRMQEVARSMAQGGTVPANSWEKVAAPASARNQGTNKTKLVTGCQELDTVLCLDDGRFRVETSWTNFSSNSGAGQAEKIPGDESGSFWFFSPDNTELLVKVLDGRHVNGNFWVFAGGLTNVETNLVVTDTLTGRSMWRRTYLGQPVPPYFDNMAFQDHKRDLTGVHVTSQSPWTNVIDIFNVGNEESSIWMDTYAANGEFQSFESYHIPGNGSTRLVMNNNSSTKYDPDPNDIILDPVEGWFMITAPGSNVQTKISYQYGESPSVTEFFLQDQMGWEYLINNPQQPQFSWFALAITNTLGYPVLVDFDVYKNGEHQGSTGVWIDPWSKYARLADGLIPGLGYDDFDTLKVRSSVGPIPPPISLTGNDSQDRHVFFNGELIHADRPRPEGAGTVTEIDSIVGNMWYVPAGAFLQGQPFFEPCAAEEPTVFVHVLSRDMAVMETEVTRGMWATLRALQPDLPPDPMDKADPDNKEPVQRITWYEAILFANLLSVQQGLSPCYFTDAGFSAPITAANYQTDQVYCNFDADGFRLPTEGEREYYCRAGTTGPFWVDEPNYNEANCAIGLCQPGLWPNLEDVAVFCVNEAKAVQPVGTKRANPWGLRDVHGNVGEWCFDWFGPYPTDFLLSPTEKALNTRVILTDYAGPPTGEYKVLRDGNFASPPYQLPSGVRFMRTPDHEGFGLGVRLVKTLNRYKKTD